MSERGKKGPQGERTEVVNPSRMDTERIDTAKEAGFDDMERGASVYKLHPDGRIEDTLHPENADQAERIDVNNLGLEAEARAHRQATKQERDDVKMIDLKKDLGEDAEAYRAAMRAVREETEPTDAQVESVTERLTAEPPKKPAGFLSKIASWFKK